VPARKSSCSVVSSELSGFRWGYTWVKTQLHTAGLVVERAKAGIGDIDAANAFIRDVYLPAHNAGFNAFVAADPALLADVLAALEKLCWRQLLVDEG
jgi:hypothetical protein